jgi:hypothetical protein
MSGEAILVARGADAIPLVAKQRTLVAAARNFVNWHTLEATEAAVQRVDEGQ